MTTLRRAGLPLLARPWMLFALTACLGWTSSASADEWTYILPDTAVPLAKPIDIATASATQRWVLAQHQGGAAALQLQTDSAAQRAITTTSSAARLLTLQDGGVLVSESQLLQSSSSLRRFDAQGLLLWQRTLAGSVVQVLADNENAFWVALNDRWVRLAADGSTRAELRIADYPVLADGQSSVLDNVRSRALRAIDKEQGDLIVAGYDRHLASSPDKPHAQIVRFGRNGQVKWSWRDSSETASLRLSAVTAARNAESCAIGNTVGTGASAGVFQQCLSAAGDVRWTRFEVRSDTVAAVGITTGTDGSTYAFDQSASLTMRRYDSNGGLLWQHTVPGTAGFDCDALTPHCGLRVDGAGMLTLLVHASAATSAPLHTVQLGSDGLVRGDRELPIRRATRLSTDSNGHAWIVGQPSSGSGDTDTTLLHLNADGVLLEQSKIVPVVLPTPVAALARADRGSVYAVAGGSELGSSYSVRRLRADGEVLWSQSFSRAIRAALISANTNLACVADASIGSDAGADASSIRCLRATDGSVLWSQRVSTPPVFQGTIVPGPTLLRVLDNNSVVLGTLTDGIEIFNADGQTLYHHTTSRLTPLAAANRSGATALLERANPQPDSLDNGILTVRNANGSQRYQLNLQTLGARVSALALDDDGLVVLVGNDQLIENSVFTWLLNSDGSVRWKQRLGGYNGLTKIAITNELFVIERHDAEFATGDVSMRVDALERVGGNRRWRQTPMATLWDIDEAQRKVQFFSASPGRWAARSVLLKDGRDAGSTTFTCADVNCTLTAALASGDTVIAGAASSVMSRQPREGAPVRIDQAGIAGAWWAPYADGEGMLLDWLPQQRLLFMPWFTFSREGGNDPAQLRWYVAQAANVASNATSANLDIYAISGGIFDSASTRTTTRVGSALLTFSSCSEGSLSYTFDAGYNGGASGTITLARLSPATQSCILADSSIQPASGARSPSKGFDARQSGSWYEPATEGQGIQLTVQPEGVLFGAWFTYDVAGAANDATQQHWLTFVGDLTTAVNGKVDLVVVQGIGGSFDYTPTRNRHVIGHASLQMQGCDRAQLTYQIDAREIAGPLQARSGSVELIKAGGCTP